MKKRVNFNEVPKIRYARCADIPPPHEKPAGPLGRFVRRFRKTLNRISRQVVQTAEVQQIAPLTSPRLGVKRKRSDVICEEYDSPNYEVNKIQKMFSSIVLNLNLNDRTRVK